jgi:heme-degrading monooxygenase HmoA
VLPDAGSCDSRKPEEQRDEEKGHRFHYLLQSAEDPTEGVTVTAWDSREDVEAYAAQSSGPFKELLGKFTRWHTRPAEVRTYEVVGGGE